MAERRSFIIGQFNKDRSTMASMLEGLKRKLNIAGAEITVTTEGQHITQGDKIKGQVSIKMPEYQQAGNTIKLELREFWTETRSTGKTTTTVRVVKPRQTVVLTRHFDFEAGSDQEFSFQVQLPINCRISTTSTGWELAVAMEIPRAVDPTGTTTLDVSPSQDLIAVAQCCETALGFREIMKSRRWEVNSSLTRFRLTPPDSLKSEFDFLDLVMSQLEDGGVEGDLIFDLQEKSLMDYLKAMVGRDKVRTHFRLARTQLYTEDGELTEAFAEFTRLSIKAITDQRSTTRHF